MTCTRQVAVLEYWLLACLLSPRLPSRENGEGDRIAVRPEAGTIRRTTGLRSTGRSTAAAAVPVPGPAGRKLCCSVL